MAGRASERQKGAVQALVEGIERRRTGRRLERAQTEAREREGGEAQDERRRWAVGRKREGGAAELRRRRRPQHDLGPEPETHVQRRAVVEHEEQVLAAALDGGHGAAGQRGGERRRVLRRPHDPPRLGAHGLLDTPARDDRRQTETRHLCFGELGHQRMWDAPDMAR